jgi:high-affinity iron transporter
VLANFLIGLREGIEAALVVGILIAYLKKSGQAERTRYIWWGVFTAIVAASALAALFTLSSLELNGKAEPFLSGLLSLLAAALITWMAIWLAKKARFMKAELEGALDRAIATGVGSLFLLAFLSVGREGLETAIFIWNGALASHGASSVVTGTILGLFVASILGWLLYLGSLKINLGKFFRYSGAALIFVAAGMFSYAISEWQEIGLIPGFSSHLFDISAIISEDGLLGTILKGALNFTPTPTVLQSAGWLLYIIPVGYLFLKKPRVASVKS